MTPNLGLIFFEILMALHIKLFLFSASLPSEVFNAFCTLGKKAIAGINKDDIYSISL